MISYIIVDDEPIAHRIIEGYCDNLPQLLKAGNCYNAFEAIQVLNLHKVDLIFLDINMPKLSGFEFLKTLSNPPKIIVTTAYREFALEGYELNICDYLLKPFSFERFMKAINKVLDSNTKRPDIKIADHLETPERFFLKGDKKYHQVEIKDILFIEAYGNYAKVHLGHRTIICHEKISSFENVFPEKQFVRVHKSFIVSVSHIHSIEGNRIAIKDHLIPIGQTYKNVVNELLKN